MYTLALLQITENSLRHCVARRQWEASGGGVDSVKLQVAGWTVRESHCEGMILPL